jgi:hypothetical protein
MSDPQARPRRRHSSRRVQRRRLIAGGAVGVVALAAILVAVDPFGGKGSKGHALASDLPVTTIRGGTTGAGGSGAGTGTGSGTGGGSAGGSAGTTRPGGGTAPGQTGKGGGTPTTLNTATLTLTLDGYGGYAVVDAKDPVAGASTTQATCRPVPPPGKGACQRQVRYHRGTSVTLHLQTTVGPWPNVSSATGPCNLKWDTSTSPVPPQQCAFTLPADASVVVTWAAAEAFNGKVTTWDYPTCPVYAHPPRKAPSPCGT